MKTLELNQMENLNGGGGGNRGCLISGFLAGVTVLAAPFTNGTSLVGTLAIISGAANAGCFDAKLDYVMDFEKNYNE